jgi:hypothetical protein
MSAALQAMPAIIVCAAVEGGNASCNPNTQTDDLGEITGTACVPCRSFRCINLARRRCISVSAHSTPSLNGLLEIRLHTQLVRVSWLCEIEPEMSNASIALEENP